MTNLIIEISKYFMIFMFAFYTYECFAAFRQKIKPEQREHILSRQCAAIFLIHFDAFVVIYLVTEDISMLIFYDIFAHHPGIDQPGWICAEIILVICNRWDPGAFGCDDRRKYKLWS